MTDLTDLGVAAIRDGVRDGAFSAREVAEAFNAAVEKGRALNAYTVETPDDALAAAEAADKARSGGELKPLSGIPLGIKDLFATKGIATTAGSRILTGLSRPMKAPSAPTCAGQARACLASSTWMSSRWARRTRPAPGAR